MISILETKKFSDRGSNERAKEEDTYIMFRDLLEEYEGMYMDNIIYLSVLFFSL